MERKKLEEIKKLLIVVDMVNGFVKKGNMADPYIGHIIPENERLVKEFLEANEGVVFIKDAHEANCLEFARYPVHCVKKTEEAELVSELKIYEPEALVYEKNSTSAIFVPNFLNDIEQMVSLEETLLTGCCTDICVMNAGIPLRNYLDQKNRNVEIKIACDAVETYDSPTHNRDEFNAMAFKFMEQAGLKLVKHYEMKKGE